MFIGCDESCSMYTAIIQAIKVILLDFMLLYGWGIKIIYINLKVYRLSLVLLEYNPRLTFAISILLESLL